MDPAFIKKPAMKDISETIREIQICQVHKCDDGTRVRSMSIISEDICWSTGG